MTSIQFTLQTLKSTDGKLTEQSSRDFSSADILKKYLQDHISILKTQLALSHVFYLKSSLPKPNLVAYLSQLFNETDHVIDNIYSLFPQLFSNTPIFKVIQGLRENIHCELFNTNLYVKMLSDTLLEQFSDKSLTYNIELNKSHWLKRSDKPSWPEVFNTVNKTTVEEICYGLGIDCRWNNSKLILEKTLRSVMSNPVTGESVCLNPNALDCVNDQAHALSLQDGDILIFYNFSYLYNYA